MPDLTDAEVGALSDEATSLVEVFRAGLDRMDLHVDFDIEDDPEAVRLGGAIFDLLLHLAKRGRLRSAEPDGGHRA